MTTDSILTVLAILLSVASVVATGIFSLRTQRLSHELEAEREARHEQQSALRAAQRVYEPLAQAAAELQSRIFNVVESGWFAMQERYKEHRDYAETSTAYLFAQYFGWVEARRQAVLSSGGEGARDLAVQRLLDAVLKTLRRSEGSGGFLFFTTEQRAIGELMVFRRSTGELAVRGYAWFVARYRDDEDFRSWFTPVKLGMMLFAEGDHERLVELQHALVALVDELDPKRKYTVGYALEPIDLGDGPAQPPV
jgi:hypothetical protein